MPCAGLIVIIASSLLRRLLTLHADMGGWWKIFVGKIEKMGKSEEKLGRYLWRKGR